MINHSTTILSYYTINDATNQMLGLMVTRTNNVQAMLLAQGPTMLTIVTNANAIHHDDLC